MLTYGWVECGNIDLFNMRCIYVRLSENMFSNQQIIDTSILWYGNTTVYFLHLMFVVFPVYSKTNIRNQTYRYIILYIAGNQSYEEKLRNKKLIYSTKIANTLLSRISILRCTYFCNILDKFQKTLNQNIFWPQMVLFYIYSCNQKQLK